MLDAVERLLIWTALAMMLLLFLVCGRDKEEEKADEPS